MCWNLPLSILEKTKQVCHNWFWNAQCSVVIFEAKNMRLFIHSLSLFSCLDEQLSAGSVGWRRFDSLRKTGMFFINLWVKIGCFYSDWPPRIVESSRFPSWRKRGWFVCVIMIWELITRRETDEKRRRAFESALFEKDIISCASESAAAAAGGVMFRGFFCCFLGFFVSSFQSSAFCVSLHWLSAGDGGQEAREHAAQP